MCLKLYMWYEIRWYHVWNYYAFILYSSSSSCFRIFEFYTNTKIPNFFSHTPKGNYPLMFYRPINLKSQRICKIKIRKQIKIWATCSILTQQVAAQLLQNKGPWEIIHVISHALVHFLLINFFWNFGSKIIVKK